MSRYNVNISNVNISNVTVLVYYCSNSNPLLIVEQDIFKGVCAITCFVC